MDANKTIAIVLCIVVAGFSLVAIFCHVFYCIYLNFCKRWGQPSSNDAESAIVRYSNIHGTVCTEIVTTNSNSTAQENSEIPMILVTKPHAV